MPDRNERSAAALAAARTGDLPLDSGANSAHIRPMAEEHPTLTIGGATYVVVPQAVAAAHGIGSDPQAEKRRKLGRKLRRARERAKLSQAQLAELLGCGQPSVSSVEHGREACSEERAAAWLEACGSTARGAKA